MKIENILCFLIITFVIGLSQIICTVIYFLCVGHAFTIPELIKDGGIFFFTNSLCLTCFFNSLKKPKFRFWFVISTLMVGSVVAISIIATAIGNFRIYELKKPFEYTGNFYRAQLVCLFISACYAFIIEFKSGGLKEDLQWK